MGTGFPRHDGVFGQSPARPTPSSLVLPPAHSSHRGHPVPTEGWSRGCALTSGRFVVAGTPPSPGSTMGTGFPRHDGVFGQSPARPTPSSLVLPPTLSSHRGHPVPTEGWSRGCALTSGRFVVAGTPPGPGSTMGAGFPRHDEERGNGRPIRDYIAASAPVVFSDLNHSGRDGPARDARMEQAS